MAFFQFDVETILSLLFLGNLAAMVVILVYRPTFSPKEATGLYALGKIAQALAWGLIRARGTIPDSLSVYLANILLFLGFGLEAYGICLADGPRPGWRLVFSATTVLGIAVFCCIAGLNGPRIGVASLVIAAIYLCLVFALFTSPKPSGLHRFIAWTALGFVATLLVRASWGFSGGPTLGVFTPSFAQTLAFIPVHLSLIVGAIGFLLLSKQEGDRAIRESEDKYRSLVEKAGEGIVIAQEGLIRFCNPRMAEILGVDASALLGQEFSEYVWPLDRGLVLDQQGGRGEDPRASGVFDFRIIGPQGQPLWVTTRATRILWQGRPASLSLLTDIDARKRQEERIVGLLSDKETLLREVHHRVKNNLTLVMGLLALQPTEGEGLDPAAVLLDARTRILSMVELYERLYRIEAYGDLSVRDYLPSLVESIQGAFPHGHAIALGLDLEEVVLDQRRLLPLGIILNEIVTNSMKYAFAKVAQPRIDISLRRSGDLVVLECRDNGPGLGAEACPSKDPGFGSQLIAMLTDQLHGKLSITGQEGMAYRLEFPLDAPYK